jgi:hypothetical protein
MLVTSNGSSVRYAIAAAIECGVGVSGAAIVALQEWPMIAPPRVRFDGNFARRSVVRSGVRRSVAWCVVEDCAAAVRPAILPSIARSPCSCDRLSRQLTSCLRGRAGLRRRRGTPGARSARTRPGAIARLARTAAGRAGRRGSWSRQPGSRRISAGAVARAAAGLHRWPGVDRQLSWSACLVTIVANRKIRSWWVFCSNDKMSHHP